MPSRPHVRLAVAVTCVVVPACIVVAVTGMQFIIQLSRKSWTDVHLPSAEFLMGFVVLFAAGAIVGACSLVLALPILWNETNTRALRFTHLVATPVGFISGIWSPVWGLLLWSLAFILAMVLAVTHRRPAAHLCQTCGYDLRSLRTNSCPECGEKARYSMFRRCDCSGCGHSIALDELYLKCPRCRMWMPKALWKWLIDV
jgi:predicted RNA-binding Zn-ribbon protein involved in translation (DUF1610 family)